MSLDHLTPEEAAEHLKVLSVPEVAGKLLSLAISRNEAREDMMAASMPDEILEALDRCIETQMRFFCSAGGMDPDALFGPEE